GPSRRMGITNTTVGVSHVSRATPVAEVDMIVDSGAIYSVVPAELLASIHVRPEGRERFALADGRTVRRETGWVLFELEGRRAPSRVIFGLRGDASLLGMVTLEELGLALDPLKRRLRPLKLTIA